MAVVRSCFTLSACVICPWRIRGSSGGLFLGPGRFWQKATERRIVHEGIALSADFMIHSSSQGVYVSPLFDDWRRAEFSWARRVL
jgi:hypothetical protein